MLLVSDSLMLVETLCGGQLQELEGLNPYAFSQVLFYTSVGFVRLVLHVLLR